MIKKLHISLGLILLHIGVGATIVDSLNMELSKVSGLEKSLVLNDLAWELSYDNSEQALKYTQEALLIGQEFNDQPTIATSYNRIGLIHDYKNEYSEALTYYKKALLINEQIGNKKDESGCLNNIGGVYYYIGDYENALVYYLKSLVIREQLLQSNKTIEIEKIIAQSHNNIAMLYKAQGDYEKALSYYKLSLETKRKIKDEVGVRTSLMNMGATYLELNNYALARAISEEALQSATKDNSSKEVASNLCLIGLTYKSESLFNQALDYFYRAGEIYDSTQNSLGFATIHINISSIFVEYENYQQAIYYAEKALVIGEEIQSLTVQIEAQKALYVSYHKLKDYERALYHQTQLIILNDSLLNIEKNRAILELSIKYETNKKQQQIELLNTKNQLQKAEIAKKKEENIALWSILGLVLAISGIIIIIIRQRKKAAEEKNLLKIQEHIKDIDFLRSQLAQKIEKNAGFNLKIEEENINQYLLSPLTNREIDVIHQIAEGKSNKEIGETLFVSVNTIKTHVLRIYEKLEIKNRTQAAAKAGSLQIHK